MEGQGTVHAANQGDYAQAAASRPGNSRTASANSRTKPPEKDRQEERIPEKAVREKEKTETSPDTSALHALNRTIADRQRQYARQFSEQAHILASRNRLLNEQLQQVIRHMDRNIQEEMQQREEKLGRTGERSLAIVAGLVVFMLLLLGGSYMIIHRDMARINRYKKRLEETIGQLEHTVAENEELIAARKRIMLTVTHDLRTPLTTINSYAELLATEKKISKRKEYNRTIRRVAGHMEAMLNTLLGFSGWRAERRKSIRFRSGCIPSSRRWKRISCRWRRTRTSS